MIQATLPNAKTDHAALPIPSLNRWQPLRLGLVNLFYYDSEEFHFRDGRLLLRGNNGTGKSKVLSLTLPFLFDAQIRPSRIEPDGDNSKRMAWNLLLGQHERRMGYTWVEFGRLDADGLPHYLTLGCGLSAVAARSQVDAWYFTLAQHRIGRDFWLMNPKRVVLTRDKLDETLQHLGGQLFRSARDYRRAVDEQLFQLGPARYDALMDTLVQLRQPQLSKKPDESSLSQALTEALPPIPSELLADVAEALTQLEEYRQELQEHEALAHAVTQFNRRYQRYAATQARRQARHVRSAQTAFDNASRTLNEQNQALAAAQTAETQAEAQQQRANTDRAVCQTRLDTLKSDPAMADAHTLSNAAEEVQRRQDAADKAREQQQSRRQRRDEEQAATKNCHARVRQLTQALAQVRATSSKAADQAGLSTDYDASLLSRSHDNRPLPDQELHAAQADLRRARDLRREQIQTILDRCTALDQAKRARHEAQIRHDERRDDLSDAIARREDADAQVHDCSGAHLNAWREHLDSLRQLHIVDGDQIIQDLDIWTMTLTGTSPAHLALLAAQQSASQQLAQQQAALLAQQQALKDEQILLQSEQKDLQNGHDPLPALPGWQNAATRQEQAGAPFWQLVDFHPNLDEAQRAGLEAALQAAGLLDAWVSPQGDLLDQQGAPIVGSAWWVPRSRQAASLAGWLAPARIEDLPATASIQQACARIQVLLDGIACGPQDVPTAEAWVAPDGRFRLGSLQGAWTKPQAQHIGHAARAAARTQRLDIIHTRLQAIQDAQQALAQQQTESRAAQAQAAQEWQTAPSDEALRTAHALATASMRTHALAQEYLQQATQHLQLADTALDQAQQTLQQDAADLHLPDTPEALHRIGQHLQDFADTIVQLALATRERQQAHLEWQQQAAREQHAREDATQADEQAAECALEAQQARTRLETLQTSIGAQVQALQAQLLQATQALRLAEQTLNDCHDALRLASANYARSAQKAEAATEVLEQRLQARQQTIMRWQDFCGTGLLASALPDLALPAPQDNWSIETALSLARRTEQRLNQTTDDDAAWSRIQGEISQDYTELGSALSALGHQAQADTSDFGLVVHIIYHNRPERPDRLEAHLIAEIAQRKELLSAREREILETHLQAEISSAIQRRLRDAQQQILAINEELQQRPTTTGVRFRLKWETLPEGVDGAPVGLEAARRHLLNTSTDLWSADDRRVVGEMLQQRIEAERSRSDTLPGSSLQEQLDRALDYRRWHRFRIERWAGEWRSLMGPASSGERALGLTVPLFAAVASFYSRGSSSHAPRLVLLDEVFAGIDEPARAHCWALIREFDLDFVVTSEREWACSAELPGVAIAQLQRREGIDAVHVSRWIWDGRTKRRVPDPDQRFPPETDAINKDAHAS
ncbi:TIGR02680 family protein [Castellaniella sp.]|uniref:TIGR02680 family protein n=1 Tax=Castellaniella sp. TaxID=1955812 RepID=UPI002AFFF241|nr:TIGR02680 family protein [Castellaniella sp.]